MWDETFKQFQTPAAWEELHDQAAHSVAGAAGAAGAAWGSPGEGANQTER